MPAQRGPDLCARFCVPNSNRKVPVSPVVFWKPPTTNYLCATRREAHRKDGVVVPAQRRLARASRRFPNFHAFVVATTGNVFTIWTETNAVDRSVKRSIVSTHHTFETRRSKRQRSSTRSARSASIDTCQSTFPISLRCCRCFHLLLLCRLETTPRTRPCDSDESARSNSGRVKN